MEKSEIKEYLLGLFEEEGVETEELDDDVHLIDDVGFDSMVILEFLSAMESKFRCSIPEEKLREALTIGGFIEVVCDSLGHEE